MSFRCSNDGSIRDATSTNTPIPALSDLWRAGPLELVNNLQIRLWETRRLEAEIGQILAEVESRGAKTTFGYGSTLALLEDIAHVTHTAAKKLLDRARALNPSHQIDGTPIPACAPRTGAAAEGAIGAGQIDAILTTLKAIPPTVPAEDRAGAEKILVDLARDAGPREIGRAGTRLLDTLDPDGPEPKTRTRSSPRGSCTFGSTATAPPL